MKLSTLKLPAALSLVALAVACGKSSTSTPTSTQASKAGQTPEQGATEQFARSASNLTEYQARVLGRGEGFNLSAEAFDPSKVKLSPRDQLLKPSAQLAESNRVIEAAGRNAGDSYSLTKWDTAVRDQKDRGWCTAFAAVSATENILKRTTGKDYDLSEYHHWVNYYTPNMPSTMNAIVKTFLLSEQDLPYSTSYSESNPTRYKPSQATVDSKGLAKMKTYQDLGSSVSAVLDAVDANKPVVIGVGMPDLPAGGWSTFTSEGAGHIKPYSGPEGNVGHAITIMGYRIKGNSGGKLTGELVIKNSWNTSWGDGGYGYLPFDYCDNYSCEFYSADGAVTNAVVPTVTPTLSPTVTPTKTPTAPPSGYIPSQFSTQVRWGYYYPSYDVQSFKLYLSSAIDLNHVNKVVYHIDPDFGSQENITVYKSATNVRNRFQIPSYLYTGVSGWTTEGTTVYMDNGQVLELPGTDIDW